MQPTQFLTTFLTQKAEATNFYAKHRLFESANKPGRLLARLARGRADSNLISSLKETYTLQTTLTILRYILTCHPPLKRAGTLCRPITEKEVYESIISIPGGKAPGPDAGL